MLINHADGKFQSTLPIQGETLNLGDNWYYCNISIHSPYTGRDARFRLSPHHQQYFNPLSLYRERLQNGQPFLKNIYFNPLSLYRERPDFREVLRYSEDFNPLSLYRERRTYLKQMLSELGNFNPLSLYRERQNRVLCCWGRGEISIHSPYTGRDQLPPPGCSRDWHFNPLSLYRERLNAHFFYAVWSVISIHSPYTGRDSNFAHKTPNIQPISYAKRQTKELFPTPTQQIITSLALISSISRCESPCIFMCTSHSH